LPNDLVKIYGFSELCAFCEERPQPSDHVGGSVDVAQPSLHRLSRSFDIGWIGAHHRRQVLALMVIPDSGRFTS
jgi:hypothetical protein